MVARIGRRMRLLSGVAAAAFIAIQFVPYGHDRTAPGVTAERSWDSPGTRALARRACFDCHSNETEWPSYARVAPVSWLVHYDVARGRDELNFSEWHRPQDEAHEAAEVVRKGEMPPLPYRLMHAHARLTAAEREALALGLAATMGRDRRGSAGSTAMPAPAGR